MSRRIDLKFAQQCPELEVILKNLIDYLKYYSTLAIQPIKYEKTASLWSVHTVGIPRFDIEHDDRSIKWGKSYEYVDYVISSKVGWDPMITKISQRTAIVKSRKIAGETRTKN